MRISGGGRIRSQKHPLTLRFPGLLSPAGGGGTAVDELGVDSGSGFGCGYTEPSVFVFIRGSNPGWGESPLRYTSFVSEATQRCCRPAEGSLQFAGDQAEQFGG